MRESLKFAIVFMSIVILSSPMMRVNAPIIVDSEATLVYDDGSGIQNKTGSVRTVTIETTLGPYSKGTSITFYYVVYDDFGGVFVLAEGSFTG